MMHVCRVAKGLIISLALLGALSLQAQANDLWPRHPIRIVVSFTPGGAPDILARVLAEHWQKNLGVPVLVENRPGGGGNIGADIVAKSDPDGYTLLMIHVSHATNLAMFKNLPYHPVDDFEPIGSATTGPMLVLARNEFPAKDLNEFVAYVKANPSKISLAHAGVGSASHLCGLMLMSTLKVKLNEIPYKGTGPALNDLMGGQVDILCDQTSGTVPAVKGGKIKAYAAAGLARVPSLPDVPAIAEAGVEGFDIAISFGLYAPKATPKPVLNQLSTALQKAVLDPDLRKRLDGMGVSAVSPERARPEALRAHLKNEIDTLGGLLVKAGVKAD